MKDLRTQYLIFLCLILLVTVLSCKREDVTIYAPTETFPEDTILKTIDNKRAMILIAHDDDMCAMSGTISALNKNGWEIWVVSIDRGESRNNAHRNACKILLDSVIFYGFSESEFRIDTASIKYAAVSKYKFIEMYNRPLVVKELVELTNQFQPSVIFSMDNDIGGYGHPDHVFISQLILDLALAGSITVDYIYQSVYTDHMETTIMERHSRRMKSWGFAGDGWEKAKLAYNVDGMPEPSVQVNIVDQGDAKMEYLKLYNKRERQVMGFYIPAFEEYTAEEYFAIFDREFFRVIEINPL